MKDCNIKPEGTEKMVWICPEDDSDIGKVDVKNAAVRKKMVADSTDLTIGVKQTCDFNTL